MKVLHVYRTCYPETNGGIEQVIRSITEGIIKHGVTCKILTLTKEMKLPYMKNGVEIIPIKQDFEISSNGFSVQLIFKFIELSKWADIIHYHYPWPTGDLLFLLQKNSASIVTYHSDIVRQRLLKYLYRPLEMWFLNNVDAIVATSPNYAKSSENLIKYQSKVTIIPLAIDSENYSRSSKEELDKWRQKVGDGFFLFIGVLRYYKGLKYLIEAAAINKLPVVIAGDGPLRLELEQQVRDLNLDNVKFLGFVSERDKISLLELCVAFVFPSHLRSEAFGVSLLEAQLFSKPLITCEIDTGSSYVNINKVTGLVVVKSNSLKLAKAMNELYLNDEKCLTYGKNGNDRFVNKFVGKTMVNDYFEIYNSVLITGDVKCL